MTVHAPQGFDLADLESKLSDAIEVSGARKPVSKLILEEF
jgi:hypothetical protein